MKSQSICLALAIGLLCPIASAQWVQTPLNSWRAYCFAVNDGNVFVGTAGWEPSNGIYLSTDGGMTWTTVNSGLTSLNITALVSSGPKLFAGSITGGVCRSTDNGSHWTPVNSGLTNNEIEALAVYGSRLLAGTLQGGVFLSTNDGTNWTQVNAGLTSMYISTIAVSDTVIFAGSPQAGVFRSTDNGTNWTAVNNGLTSASIMRLAVKGSCIFAGTGDSKVFRSTNSGASWTEVSIGPFGGIMSFAFYNNNVFAGTDMWGGVFLSTNDGASWHHVGTGLPNRDVQALAVIDTCLLAGTYGSGVWRRPLSEMIPSSASMICSPDAFWTWTGEGDSTIATLRIGNSGGTSLNWSITTDPAVMTALSWLSVDPSSGSTLPGGQTEVTVTMRAVQPVGSIQQGSLTISSNDTVLSSKTLPVHLSVFQILSLGISIEQDWNILSVPLLMSDYSKSTLFPSATTSAFRYQPGSGYVSDSILANGLGYWLKFPAAETRSMAGFAIDADTFTVQAGWNIIGSISGPVDVESIASIPAGIITSDAFGYVRGQRYRQADTLYPGFGYWVKANEGGSVVLTSPKGLPCPGIPTVTYAGKVYNTVQIGSQCWLKEDLDVGTMILGTQEQTNNGTIEKYCYNDDPANCLTYGGLYQWNEAMQYSTTQGVQGICPPGWHAPTLAEFQTLGATVGGNGNALKAIGQGSGGGAGTNASGFSALLAGARYNSGFGHLGDGAYLWSSTQTGALYASRLLVFHDGDSINLVGFAKYTGLSVRCIKD